MVDLCVCTFSFHIIYIYLPAVVLQHANHIFDKTIPVNQIEIPLHPHKVTTLDSVELSVKAILIVRIADPLQAIRNFDASTAVLRERAEAVLCNIFSSVNYREREAVFFHHRHPYEHLQKGKQERGEPMPMYDVHAPVSVGSVGPAAAQQQYPAAEMVGTGPLAMTSNTLFRTVQGKFKQNFAEVIMSCGVEIVQFGVVEALPTDVDYLRTMSDAAKMSITVEKNLRKANGERDVQAQELENEMERARRRQEIVEIETATEVNRIAAIGEAKADAMRTMVSAAGDSAYAISKLQADALGQLGSTPGTLIFGDAPFGQSHPHSGGSTAATGGGSSGVSALPSIILNK
jgi:SPFH domain / Band 7 family